jgi:hypothetical protein
MECDKAIGIIPMPAGLAMSVYNCDVCIRLRQQRVSERQTYRSCPNDQIVGFNMRHAALPSILVLALSEHDFDGRGYGKVLMVGMLCSGAAIWLSRRIKSEWQIMTGHND